MGRTQSCERLLRLGIHQSIMMDHVMDKRRGQCFTWAESTIRVASFSAAATWLIGGTRQRILMWPARSEGCGWLARTCECGHLGPGRGEDRPLG